MNEHVCVCVDSLLKSISTSHYIELSIRLEIICHVTFRYVAAAAGFIVMLLSDDMKDYWLWLVLRLAMHEWMNKISYTIYR